MKIGVTSVIGDEYRKAVNNQDVKFKPAEAALKEVVPKLEAAKCDLLVLLSNATKDESIMVDGVNVVPEVQYRNDGWRGRGTAEVSRDSARRQDDADRAGTQKHVRDRAGHL